MLAVDGAVLPPPAAEAAAKAAKMKERAAAGAARREADQRARADAALRAAAERERRRAKGVGGPPGGAPLGMGGGFDMGDGLPDDYPGAMSMDEFESGCKKIQENVCYKYSYRRISMARRFCLLGKPYSFITKV